MRHFLKKIPALLALLALPAVAQAGEERNEAPFELEDWYLGLPIDADGDGKADSISEKRLADGWTDPRFFFYSPDGGISFRAPVTGAKTSKNTNYVRTELREMLRRGNTSIKTAEPGKNNWVLSSAPKKARKKAGAMDGELHATLKIDHVTTTGAAHEIGRVIIGQIHGRDDEPVRLYYRKLPQNQKGALYFAHEVKGEDEDQYHDLIGSRHNSAPEPQNGIGLGEKFSYSIVATSNLLEVSILKDSKVLARKRIDMSGSGYDAADEYLYFKAGVYNQNKTGDAQDYVQATFYKLKNLHAKAK